MPLRAPYVEKLDSSAAQTRALAAALHGRHFDSFDYSLAQRSFLRLFPLVPDVIIPPAISLAAGVIGIPQSTAENVRTADMCADIASLYPEKKYKSIIVGAPNGAVSHIGAINPATLAPPASITLHSTRPVSGLSNVQFIVSTISRLYKSKEKMIFQIR